MPIRTLARPLIGIGAGLALVLAVPLAASAHVTINPDQAEPGGWTYVTFRAPNESASASTVELQVHLPTDTPFTSVTYQATPGWTTTVATEKLPAPVTVSGNTVSEAPATVVIRADAGGIAPGQFQTFTLALGPVPDVGHVVIPVTQTYSDGTVVEWRATPEQVGKDDTLEPAPVLYIRDAPPAGASHGVTATATPDADAAAGAGSGDSGGGSGLATGLGVAALVLGAAGVLMAALALGGRRRTAS